MEKWKFKVGWINFELLAQFKIFVPLYNNKYATFVMSLLHCSYSQFTHMIVNPTDTQFKNDQRVDH